MRDWDRPYNLGDNEFHLAFYVDDYEAALKKHKEMGVVAYENADMVFTLLLIQMGIGQKSFQQVNTNGIYVNSFRVASWSR